jgi:hypothetical protein
MSRIVARGQRARQVGERLQRAGTAPVAISAASTTIRWHVRCTRIIRAPAGRERRMHEESA